MLHNEGQSSSGSMASGRPTSGAQSKHAQLLMQFNKDIFKRNVLTDVQCIVEGQVFKTHRSVLICFSPFLKRKLISSDGKPLANKIYIPKIGANEFELLLHYMYSGTVEVDCNTFFDVYRAASMLEMHDAKQQCLQVMDGRDEIRTYFYGYVLSKTLGIQHSWQRALRLITHRFEESVFSKEFLQLSIEHVLEILSAQTIGARSETIVFLAALHWLNYDPGKRGDAAELVMRCVRFSAMSMEEIVACYHPPFFTHIVQIPEVKMMLFRATCYIAAKSQGQEAWFKEYACPKRVLTLESLTMELWHKRPPPPSTATRLVDYSGYDGRPNPELLDNPVEVIAHSTGQESKHMEWKPATEKYANSGHPENDLDGLLVSSLSKYPDTLADDVQTKDSHPYFMSGKVEARRESSSDEVAYADVHPLTTLNRLLDNESKTAVYPLSEAERRISTEASGIQSTTPRIAKIVHLQRQVKQLANKPREEKMSDESRERKEEEMLEELTCRMDKENIFDAVNEITKTEQGISSQKDEDDVIADEIAATGATSGNQNLVPDKPVKEKHSPLLLFIGGINPKENLGGEIFSFDPKTKKFRKFSNMFMPRHNHCAAVIDDEVYVTGGCCPKDTVEKKRYIARRSCFKLNLRSMKWATLPDMKCCRCEHGMVEYDGHLFVAGGEDENGRLLKSIEVYDPKRSRWRFLNTNMCCGRKAMGMAVHAERIWIVGGLIHPGQDRRLQAVTLVDCYHPGENKWYFNIYSLPSARCFCSLADWSERLYCVGGMTPEEQGRLKATDEVWYVDSQNELWKKGPSLPKPKMGGAVMTCGKNLYSVGGLDPVSDPVGNICFLTPGATQWTEGPALPIRLLGLAAVIF